MNKKSKQWCAVSRCMNSSIQEKRHFFRFPKEHDRWLQWIKASNRLDLEPKGPNYAYNNCTLCHLHFEEKWFIKKSKLRLHPDAVPTIFFDRNRSGSRSNAGKRRKYNSTRGNMSKYRNRICINTRRKRKKSYGIFQIIAYGYKC